ncbi:MAG: hypothetical protein AMXMBFR82_29520 [Candidatus Hydrogenedentota bacterium]
MATYVRLRVGKKRIITVEVAGSGWAGGDCQATDNDWRSPCGLPSGLCLMVAGDNKKRRVRRLAPDAAIGSSSVHCD